jgi:crotonobetainyl-CoA:carnitine CoA-transferase CaiB-like acyl-CoA transferase
VIDVALVDSITRLLTCRIASYLGSGELPTRSGGTDSVIAIYQTFATADEPITLALGNDNLWQRFWAAVGDPAYAESDEFRTNADRRRNRAQIVSRIASVLREKPRSHWLAVLREARIPAGPINDLSQVVADEAMLARGMFYRVALESGGSMPQVGTGIVIDGECASPRSPPAALGENTDDILERLLGLTEHERHTLEQEKIIRRRNA